MPMRCQAPQGSCAKREAVASFAKCQLMRANFYCPNSEAGDGPWPHVMHVMRFAASRQMHATVRQAPGTSGTGGFAVTGAERTLR